MEIMDTSTLAAEIHEYLQPTQTMEVLQATVAALRYLQQTSVQRPNDIAQLEAVAKRLAATQPHNWAVKLPQVQERLEVLKRFDPTSYEFSHGYLFKDSDVTHVFLYGPVPYSWGEAEFETSVKGLTKTDNLTFWYL